MPIIYRYSHHVWTAALESPSESFLTRKFHQSVYLKCLFVSEMYLSWIKKEVKSVQEALLHIGRSPPPISVESSNTPSTESSTSAFATDNEELSPPAATQPGTEPKDSTVAGVHPAFTPGTDRKGPVFFALIIGINDYKYIKPLNGCVADADDMFDYLTNTLGVLPSHIINLRNEQASRRAIKESIAALTLDDRIQPGDPILIFFAGHGAEVKAPQWATGSLDPDQARIQMILPIDFKSETNGVEDWQGIPDITLAALLSNLAKAKGDNITVIHDCCHAGSSTRSYDDTSPDTDVYSRGIELSEDYQILSSLDSDTLDGGMRMSEVSTGFLKTAMASHVLVAACSQSMKAHEYRNPNSGMIRGNFTRELLKFLRSPTVQGAAITYTELIERLPDLPGGQHPQCDGFNRDRLLFDGKAPKRDRWLYQVSRSVGPRSTGNITLQAGEVHGITQNAIVSIFLSSDTTVPIGRLQVSKIRACSSVLRYVQGDAPYVVPQSAWAVVVKAGDSAGISVGVPMEDSFLPLFVHIIQEMEAQRPEKREIQVVERNLPHELALSSEYGDVIFEMGDLGCVEAGLIRIPETVPVTDTDGIYMVLNYAADFFFHLRRRSSSGSLARSLTLEIYTLEQNQLDCDPNAEPVLIPSSGNLYLNGAAALHVVANDTDEDYDELAQYGFRLVNRGKSDLHVWAFMFDMSNLKIRCIHQPTVAKKKADPSVRAGGELTIGYGSGGGIPQIFTLQDDEQVDVSYLKLFVSTQYVDLSYIAQESPFENLGVRASMDAPAAGAGTPVWDTVRLMIVQRRRDAIEDNA